VASAKKAAAAAGTATAERAQGAPGKKRTPSGAFDAAAGKDIYEPEFIKAMAHAPR
jgi:hypothetical protein